MSWDQSNSASRSNRAPSRWLVLGAFLLLAVLYLSRLGGYALQDPDEGRYAEIPREMIESGDWVTPRLNYVSYFEKPPLLYWTVAVAFEALGQTEGAARLTPALAALCTVWLTYVLGSWIVGRRAALLGTAILASTPLFFAFSQALVIDMLLTAAMTGTLVAFYGACRSDAKRGWAVLTAVASAAAVLAKGPVGLVLPGAIALAYLALRRDGATTRALLSWEPIGVFAVLVVPWFVLVSWRNPEFLDFFFVHEHLQRFAGDVGHPETTLYYLPVLLLGALPWSLLALGLLLRREGRSAFGRISGEARLLLGLWSGITVVFFSVASSKLPGYVLPAFPPVALLAGAWVDELYETKLLGRALARTVTALWVVALAYVAVWLVGEVAPAAVASSLSVDAVDVTAVAAAVGAAGAAMLVVALGRALLAIVIGERNDLTFGAVALALLLCLWAVTGGRTVVRTSREIAYAARGALDAGAQLVAYRQLMQGLPFYTGHRVVQVDARGELWHGALHAADEKQFFWRDVHSLARAWAAGPVVIATSADRVAELQNGLDPPPRVLAHDGDRYLLGRPDVSVVGSSRTGPPPAA